MGNCAAQDAARRSQSMNSAALHAALTQKLTRLQGLEVNGRAAGGGSSSSHGSSSHNQQSDAKKKAALAATELLNDSFDSHVSAMPTAVGVPGAVPPFQFELLLLPVLDTMLFGVSPACILLQFYGRMQSKRPLNVENVYEHGHVQIFCSW